MNLSYVICFHSDPAVHALQFLDVINMKDPTQKTHFYRSTLKDVLPYIPRVSRKLEIICCIIHSGYRRAIFNKYNSAHIYNHIHAKAIQKCMANFVF